ncbi:hypothetical protein [Pedobacter sp. L105]|uniref:hypothetical protein n=1 Tax=Pedobacter sp. L105 TaxID=1641871 RepID=UPI001576959C|nr:hypothetical protein [Pedobacter sp. L105]
MKKVFTILCLTIIAAFAIQTSSKAQGYDNAIGGRFGEANGVTFKTTLGENKMLDLIANFRSHDGYRYFRVTGLYEIYNPITNAPGLNWYYGVGGSIGSAKYIYTDNTDLYLSVDGVLGLDYKFADAPINISLDWKPAIQLSPDSNFDASGLGLSVRFTF